MHLKKTSLVRSVWGEMCITATLQYKAVIGIISLTRIGGDATASFESGVIVLFRSGFSLYLTRWRICQGRDVFHGRINIVVFHELCVC